MEVILGIPFTHDSMESCVYMLDEFIESDKTGFHVVTPNPEIVMLAQKKNSLMTSIRESELVVPDGIGIAIASFLRGGKIRKRITGIDLISALWSYRTTKGKTTKVYLLGATKSVVSKASQRLNSEFESVEVVGFHHGYDDIFDECISQSLIRDINKHSPDLLLVGVGSPNQEEFIFKHKKALKASICIGCGGAIDILSGMKKRAPLWIRRMHLEWFYRLCKEPRRIKRQLYIPFFLWNVCVERFTGGRQ